MTRVERQGESFEIDVLLRHIRRYRVAAIHVQYGDAQELVGVLRGVWSNLQELDLLEQTNSAALDVFVARDLVRWTEAANIRVPAVITGSEALWTVLASNKLDDAWRALVLSEVPRAPRILLLHSQLFLDRFQGALNLSPEPQRLFHR